MLRTWSIKLNRSDSSSNQPEKMPSTRSDDVQQADSTVSLSSIGWDQSRVEEFSSLAVNGPTSGATGPLKPARVASVYGQNVLLITEDGTTRGEPSSELSSSAETAADLPATGDWVAFRERPSHDADVIEFILPRRSQLMRTRQVMHSSVETQIVATNLDVAFIVHAANNVNVRRLEREATQVSSSGAEVVIVLNKADLCGDINELLDDVAMSLPLVNAHAVSGVTGEGVEALAAYAKPDRTVAFLGASGVGKSTLTNRILGHDLMDTGEVREDDQRGRHTTTTRNLIPLPDGGALVDTPGIRSLGLSEADEGVETVFEDIVELALNCRFNDCSHSKEPGCAVQEAIETGDLTEERLGSFEKLSREMEFIRSKSDLQLRHAKRDSIKARTKGIRQVYKVREKFGRSE